MRDKKLFLITTWAWIALTPTLTHATPTTPAHHESDGREDTPISAATVPRLAPVYPLLDTTLGFLSFAAFAVYIVMLFGGLLARENPAREAVDRWET